MSRRPVAVIAVALAIAVGVPTTLLVRESQDRRAVRLDAQVEGAARDVLAVLFEGDDGIDTTTYVQTPQAAGAPATAVFDDEGDQLAGDLEPKGELLRVIRRRLRADLTAPVTVDGVRLVVRAVQGEEEPIGGVAAQLSTQDTEDADRRAVILGLALGGGGWLLLTGAASALVLRLLRDRTGAAAREQAFLADAAHELKTPWAVVGARAEQGLREQPASPHLTAIAALADQAGTTIGDMLVLARLDGGRAGDTEPVRLDALADTLAEERRDAALERGVVLDVETEGKVVVEADGSLLGQAVGNLLDNAIRHGGGGGSVHVAVASAGGRARLTVTDRGPGVPPAQRERIFDRFARAAGTAGGGAGLGLPITRAVARAHGGDVTLEPDPDGRAGARFVLDLPAA